MFTHSANFIVLIVAFVRHEISLVRLFFAPLPAAPGGNCPPSIRKCFPVSYATGVDYLIDRFGRMKSLHQCDRQTD